MRVDYEAYKEARRLDALIPTSAIDALCRIRCPEPTLDLDWGRDGRCACLSGVKTPGGIAVDVRLRLEPDDSPCLDYLGRWSDKPEGDCVDLKQRAKHGQESWDRTTYRYWIAPESRKASFCYYNSRKCGLSRQDAWCLATTDFWRSYQEARKEREVYYLVCEVCAAAADRDVVLGDVSIWGIDLAHDRWQDAVAYLNAVAAELLPEALAAADRNAKALISILTGGKQ